MVIIEIWVPEAIVVFFLILLLLRPFIKSLWHVEGLSLLPFIGLGIMAGIFPAYGFRPECLPMLVFMAVYTIAGISHPKDSFHERGSLLTALMFVVLGMVAIPMFVFSPKTYARPRVELEPARTLKLPAQESSGGEYFVQIYNATAESNQPVILLIPPEIGSSASIEMVCTVLREKGYTVVTYCKQGYDTPLIYESGRKSFVALPKLLTYWRIFKKAAASVSANEKGKVLETERQADVEYLLPLLPALLNNTGNNEPPPFLLAGYGAGGSALAYLAGEQGFISRNTHVLGVVAIESYLWSSYLPERRDMFKAPQIRGRYSHWWADTVVRLNEKLPKKLGRQGNLPQAGLPLLYLISGKALDHGKGQTPYQAVFDSLRSSSGPVALAAIEGAGPLDYQDFAFTHPLYSFLFPGLKNSPQSENPVNDTASIIGNFACWLTEQKQSGIDMPPRHAISGSLYIESKGLPNFQLNETTDGAE